MDFDATMKKLAPVSEHLSLGEQAADDQEWATARLELEHVDIGLGEVREAYRDAEAAQRPLIAKLAAPQSKRRDELAARIPALKVVSEGRAEEDPEQEIEPDE
jgi:hypothetical protein